jgi:hypothetical protein
MTMYVSMVYRNTPAVMALRALAMATLEQITTQTNSASHHPMSRQETLVCLET